MDVRVAKNRGADIAYIPNVHAMVEMPSCKIRIIGTRKCDCCGATTEVYCDASFEDHIEVIPTLK